jgi:hypothetical protein
VYEGETVLPPPHAAHDAESKNLPAGLVFLAVRLRCTRGGRSHKGGHHRGPAVGGWVRPDRSRMPGFSSGVPMKSMPAASNAVFSCTNVEVRLCGNPSNCSNLLIVRTPKPDFSASSSIVHRSAALADRICIPVIIHKHQIGPYSAIKGSTGAHRRTPGAQVTGTAVSSVEDAENQIFNDGERCEFPEATRKSSSPPPIPRRLGRTDHHEP